MALSDWFLLAEERANPVTRIDADKPGRIGWTTGNTVRPIVHGRPYFAELYERISAMEDGDRLWFVDWRGDPDQLLTADPQSTLSNTLVAAAERGVDVRGLLWRSHWRHLGFHSHKARYLGEDIEAAGGQCLRDMRVRAGGSHHQKFVVLRHRGAPERDVAYVGGIDLCHSRGDDAEHRGDQQVIAGMPEAYGPRPAWHDIQVAVTGPAVADVETTFRERWEDSVPLTVHPARRFSSFLQDEDLQPRPLGERWPAPEPLADGHEAVQVLRTFPVIAPQPYDFAPEGEQSVALGNVKAIAGAERLVYVEDQYLWSEEVGEHFAKILRAKPELRLVLVLPLLPDEDGAVNGSAQLYGRRLALSLIREAGGDRVAAFGLTAESGRPVYVHSKACVIDDRWASVGSDNLNRRSWHYDTEIACAVMDTRVEEDGATGPGGRGVPRDAFAATLRRTLVAEHLGCAPDEVPDDPAELFAAMTAAADALDAWFEAGAGSGRGDRPAGRLRPLPDPDVSGWREKVGAFVYASVHDPDGSKPEERRRLRRLGRPTLRPRLYR